MLQHLPHSLRLAALLLMLLMLGTFWSTASHAQVYRCGNTYSDAPCPGNQIQIIDAQPAVSNPEHPDQQPIFLCRLGQRQFWSAQSCQSQNASLVSSQSVARHWSWEQQHQHAQRLWQQAQRSTPHRADIPHHADTSTSAQRQRARPDCAQADRRIRKLDEMGRRGGSSGFMDRIREERKDLRDWQFRAGCGK